MIACRNVSLLLAAALLAAGLAGSCGGSSSETPWPVEPVDAVTDPRGEDLVTDNVVDTSKLPDNYNKPDGGAAGAGATASPKSDAPAPF